MVKRNSHFEKLKAGYLFPEIDKRKRALLEKNPDAKLISLGIGDTTEPLVPHVSAALEAYSESLGTKEGYSGYGPFQGWEKLRKKTAHTLYKDRVSPDAIFISDGAKCDIGRMQLLFPEGCKIAIQDPAYPVYVDTSIMTGKEVIPMPCTPKNDFFPKPEEFPAADLYIICSPNNPTGTTATKEQLSSLVEHARKNNSLILFDAAYGAFIHDDRLPRSIYEIEGAEKVAIEMNSLSKMAGFTGVRLGWTVVPSELQFEDGSPVAKDWSRIFSTCFNGAPNLSQAGALAVLDPQGLTEVESVLKYYLENAAILRNTLNQKGIRTFGGEHIPYIWASFPNQSSWDVFEKILYETHLVTTPGSGFGPSGEGFVRFSAFGHRETILEAAERLANWGREAAS